MTRESAHDKGRRYLVEGRLTVRAATGDAVVAFTRGDSGELYHTCWTRPGGWSCNCPARTDRCAHLVALRLITVVNPEASE